MSNQPTPIIPLAAVVTRPDENWEYLDSLRTHTIELIKVIRDAALICANENIVSFHTDYAAVSHHIEVTLDAVQKASTQLEQITLSHQGKSGYAMKEDQIMQFLAIGEQYTLLQQWLLEIKTAHTMPLYTYAESARQAALNAQQTQAK